MKKYFYKALFFFFYVIILLKLKGGNFMKVIFNAQKEENG
jgi:hypothetical protein